MNEHESIGCKACDAYLDGELSALESAAFEQHVSDCATCQKQLDRKRALSADLRASLEQHTAGAVLRQRVLSDLPASISATAPASIRALPSRRRQWLSLAAAASIAAIVASSSTFYALQVPAQVAWDEAVLDSHLRATLSGHVFDVASSDRHTVKPWFSGRTAVAPVVVDLSTAGYPLMGGRLDVLERTPLPVLVYQAGPHVISVVVRPGSGNTAPILLRKDGFAMLNWRAHGFDFTAVSDADSEEIMAFQQVFAGAVEELP